MLRTRDRERINAWLAQVAEASPADADSLDTALLIALLLATGLDLDSLLGLSAGPQQVLDPAGRYLRSIPLPEQRFTPTPELAPALAQHADQLELPLPHRVQRLLALRLDSAPSQAATLQQWIGGDPRSWTAAIESRLKSLAVSQRHPPTPGQVRRCLRHELLRLSGDMVIAYLLTGVEREAPPVAVYYTAVASLYREAIAGILP